MENKIAIIGSGRVAQHLAKAFSNKGIDVQLINSRTLSALPQSCDLYIIAVSDNAIADVARKMMSVNGIVVHTSGATSSDVLNMHSDYGILYPCQTFSTDDKVAYSSIPLVIDANSNESLSTIERIARLISRHTFCLNDTQRAHLHVAAVIANNFTNHLLSRANDYMQSNDLPFELLETLMRQTIDKAFTIGPRNAQTGPAVRGDNMTIAKHLSLINDDDLKLLYKTLTDNIITYHKTN